ncbi:hypothetical protein VOWphi5012_048 [Vibrio phage phi50-12]|uniref:Uncharacterized protein n=1 Tax=Vibrio phage phi50-12 TaxID=2654972 RepID=A0A5P8PRD1_9CAUD|nr:hypothetical protein KNU82_gp048 [Vibrio phage phi50-12]QFR59832.1 hypothetical protein VOWphi5012_048 [Vibrio phage phi50-12]
MTKSQFSEGIIKLLFDSRLDKAKACLTEVATGTAIVGNLLIFRDITAVYTSEINDCPIVVPEDTVTKELKNDVLRVYNIMKEKAQVAEALRYLANCVEEPEELAVIIFANTNIHSGQNEYVIPESVKEIIASNQDKFDLINKMLIKKEMYV